MANVNRHKLWNSDPVVAAVDSATVIEIGDLVFLDTDDAKPASSVAAASSLALTQEAFHDKFLGVAAQQSRAGDTDDIRVDSSGVHEFPCDSANFEIGDLIGPAAGSGFAIVDQKVVAVATANLAIGRCAQRGTALTKVFVKIESVVMAGGVQAMA